MEYDGGQELIEITDPAKELPAAIFFTDVGVLEILPPFYVNNVVEMTKGEVKKN